MKKPNECTQCPGSKLCTGYVPDFIPLAPKIALVLKMPGRDDVAHGTFLSGNIGRWFTQTFLTPIGLRRDDITVSSVIRCFPNAGDFPIGVSKSRMFETCRQWDEGLRAFNPTIWGVCFNPLEIAKNRQRVVFIERQLRRAADWVAQGERPVLLCGDDAMSVYAPWLNSDDAMNRILRR